MFKKENILTQKQKNIKIMENIGLVISAILFFLLLKIPETVIQDVLLKKIPIDLIFIVFMFLYFGILKRSKYNYFVLNYYSIFFIDQIFTNLYLFLGWLQYHKINFLVQNM